MGTLLMIFKASAPTDMYYQQCQDIIYKSCAYGFSDFPKVDTPVFNSLRQKEGQNVPMTVERGVTWWGIPAAITRAMRGIGDI
jgi:hypothetical protein